VYVAPPHCPYLATVEAVEVEAVEVVLALEVEVDVVALEVDVVATEATELVPVWAFDTVTEAAKLAA
jgi:hypothetical protein